MVLSAGEMPQARSDLRARPVGDEVVLLDRLLGQIHQLNATAGFVWSKLNGKNSLQQIAELVAAEFEVDPVVAVRDVLALVDVLRRRGLLESGFDTGGSGVAGP